VYTLTWAGVQLSSSRDRTRDTVVPSDLVSFASEEKANQLLEYEMSVRWRWSSPPVHSRTANAKDGAEREGGPLRI
jgi:hypothetical protein